MTKYVLNSGGMSNNPDGAKRFFAELLAGLGDKPRVLLCNFAQPREVWEEKLEAYKEGFKAYLPDGVEPVYDLAFPDSFKRQIEASDAVYCHGGDDYLVKYWFKKLDVANAWQGKVVGTNSATTHALSRHFWTCDWRQLQDGLGILPIKTLAHFKSSYGDHDPRGPIDWDKAKAELESYGDPSLPLYALPEGEFIVIEQ